MRTTQLITSIKLNRPITCASRRTQLVTARRTKRTIITRVITPRHELRILAVVGHGRTLKLLTRGSARSIFAHDHDRLLTLVRVTFKKVTTRRLFFNRVSAKPDSSLGCTAAITTRVINTTNVINSLVGVSTTRKSTASSAGFINQIVTSTADQTTIRRLLSARGRVTHRILRRRLSGIRTLQSTLLTQRRLITSRVLSILKSSIVSVQTATSSAAK